MIDKSSLSETRKERLDQVVVLDLVSCRTANQAVTYTSSCLLSIA